MQKISQRDTSNPSKEEMEKHFKTRTDFHIGLVQKYLQKIQDMNLPGINNEILEQEKDHDSGKWKDPEHSPYLHVNWKYKMQNEGKKYEPPQEIKDKMDEATFHHITTHKHHPDYWDENITRESLNSQDRDKPSGKIVDATKMPLSYVASMMADWAAMSEEKGTSLKDWINKNVNIRWKFSPQQVALIHKLESSLTK
jgi:hypothetical protein